MRWLVAVLGLAAVSLAAEAPSTLRGKLSAPATLEVDGKKVPLTGDEDTVKILNDKRLLNADLEVKGALDKAGHFKIDPIHTKAMFVHKDGKRLMITYWCDLCSIRTYAPGICWCCQEETQLDLREHEHP